MTIVDKIVVDNRLSDGTQLFNIGEDGDTIQMGLIVVDNRIGRVVVRKETGEQYSLGFVMTYESGETFVAIGLHGVEDIIAPSEQFSFVEVKDEQ